MAILNIKERGHCFVGNVTQHSNRTPAVPPPTPAPVPAPVPATAPAPGLAAPAAILPRVSSVIEQIYALSDWLQLDMELVHMGREGGGVQPVTHHVAP